MTKMPENYTYDNEPLMSTKTFTGTDIYLTAVTVLLTSMIVRTGLTVVLYTHNFMLPDNYIWTLMAISGVVAGKNCLSKDSTLLYKTRVCNSISSGLQTVFVGPFTAIAQMSRSLSSGFTITRNLFD